MKNIVVIEQKQGLTNTDIASLKKKLMISLPFEYESFLLLYNGGHPNKNCYPLIDTKLYSDSEVAWFYAFYDGETSNLVKEFEREKGTIPDGFIPVAYSSGGNLICLCVNSEKYGALYLYNWEAGCIDNPTYSNMSLIANNFNDFINSLYGLNVEYDKNGHDIIINTHDKYSLPFSTQVKKYGSTVTEFFTNAPIDVKDYIIKEKQETNDITLYYDIKSEGRRCQRSIRESGNIEDATIKL